MATSTAALKAVQAAAQGAPKVKKEKKAPKPMTKAHVKITKATAESVDAAAAKFAVFGLTRKAAQGLVTDALQAYAETLDAVDLFAAQVTAMHAALNTK